MLKKLSLIIGITCFLSGALFGQAYQRLHRKSIVADAHNDVLWAQTMKGRDISHKTTIGNTDLDRLKEGGVNLQIFSIFCNETYGKGKAYSFAIAMMDSLQQIAERNSTKLVLAKDVKDIKKIIKSDRIAGLMGVEGGHMIENNLDYLDEFARRGIKYLTLTWNNSTEWATSAADETAGELSHKGLTERGEQIVKRLNAYGIIPDLSHVGEQTFYDVLKVTTKPVIVSHSNCHEIAPHARNLKDEQIKAIAKNGGVIGINFYSGFIDKEYQQKIDELLGRYPELVAELSKQYSSKGYVARALFQKIPKSEVDGIRPPLSLMIDHIDRMVKLAGIDHVGIGGDFDGAESFVFGLDDVRDYPLITEELMKRGYRTKDIKKILGENLLRVLKANEL